MTDPQDNTMVQNQDDINNTSSHIHYQYNGNRTQYQYQYQPDTYINGHNNNYSNRYNNNNNYNDRNFRNNNSPYRNSNVRFTSNQRMNNNKYHNNNNNYITNNNNNQRYSNNNNNNRHHDNYHHHRQNNNNRSFRSSYNNNNSNEMTWSPNYYGYSPMYYISPANPLVSGTHMMDMSLQNNSDPNSSRNSVSMDDSNSSSNPNDNNNNNNNIRISPQPKKIEITTKTGEHLDLKTLHSQNLNAKIEIQEHLNNNNKENDTINDKEKNIIIDKDNTTINDNNNNSSSIDNKEDEKDINNNNDIEKSSNDAEKTRKAFVEIALARKALMEKNKLQKDDTNEDENNTNNDTTTTTPIDNDDNESKNLTFMQRIKLKKQITNKDNTDDIEKEKITNDNADDTANNNNEKIDSLTTTVHKEVSFQETEEDDNENKTTSNTNNDMLTMTQLVKKLISCKPVDDIYSFNYPDNIEKPDVKYKKNLVKYTYGPNFLIQFKDHVNVIIDDDWKSQFGSKIVIPEGSLIARSRSSRDSNRFNNMHSGLSNRMNNNNDFRSGSMRNDGRSNSRSSKRNPSRKLDDRKSNRGYTSRRDREKNNTDYNNNKIDVAPLVKSENRWIPKSRMKKTEKKIAPDGITELIEISEVPKKMKSLLNKLTLEKFDKLSTEILNIANQSQWEKNGETLTIVIEEVFHKACDEPHWSSMYAQLCGKLVKDINSDISDESTPGKIGPKLVLHYLVQRCHTEFEKGWSDKLPTNDDGTPLAPDMLSDEYYQAAAAKRRGLGLVRLIGYLYRSNLLSGKMMFECFRRLMKDLTDSPTEETLESVIELLTTVGAQFENDKFTAGAGVLEGYALLDSLFELIEDIVENSNISSRIKFKLLDIKELREEKNWDNGKEDAGPKTIQQIHEEDEKQRRIKNARMPSRRISSRNVSGMHNNNNNNNNYRTHSRRDGPTISKDNFISARSGSQRQKPGIKEESKTTLAPKTNMFDALRNHDDDD